MTSKSFDVNLQDFGPDFKWGVSTAAYQIEGGHNAHGKGPSIWDTFSKKHKKIAGNQHGDVACDFYNHYANDILLMYTMNIRQFRFSISWSRVLPHGVGQVNMNGIDFYNRIIDLCLELGIEPWITLYHWDLPEALQQQGGWTNRAVIHWFTQYTECCMRHFGDRVKYWMVLNEPMVFTGAGYFLGVHAPGKKGLSNFLAAAHHACMCQAEGARVIRSMCAESKIGSTFSYSHIEAATIKQRDQLAATKVDALLNRLFLEPALGMGYPVKELSVLSKMEQFMCAGDEQQLAFEFDFIGLQNYTREVIAYSPFVPFLNAKIIKAIDRRVETTLMNWEVYPPAIHAAIMRLNTYSGIKEIVITENGAAFTDQVSNGHVNDPQRVKYLQDHIAQVHAAVKAGAKVTGYFVWTFLDNFEWAEGYRPRFGLVYVDFETQQRIIKQSGHWYADFIQPASITPTSINHPSNCLEHSLAPTTGECNQ